MSVTSKDVALRARVSSMTVSRVFNPRPGFPIAPATRERVRAAARELNYRPNRLARALATGHTHVVTLHIPELSAYYTEVVRALQSLLQDAHYEIILLIDAFCPEAPDAPLPERRSFPSDGQLAVDLSGRMGADLLRQSSGPDATPLVVIGSTTGDLDCVGTDLYAGVVEALRHLAESGARSIGYVVWDYANHAGDARRDAFDTVVRETGLEALVYPVSWPSREVARRELGGLLAAGPVPDALFCFNDDLAIGTCLVLRERGVRVPEDVLLCGCDGIADTEFLTTPLTTVRLPIHAMCARAWALLRERMEDTSLPPRQEVLHPQLIVRQSTLRCDTKPVLK